MPSQMRHRRCYTGLILFIYRFTRRAQVQSPAAVASSSPAVDGG
ncbi:MAG TPA: hypothetical protein VHL11_08860 [Phototrophicaceae bacterium]|nr:hypothetical protein [Phototrophicaceae bacterium]